MYKIAIIGSPGAGKTTLAKKLKPIFNIKVYHLDRHLWKRDWRTITGESRIDILQNFVREKHWIIEGTYLRSSVPRLNEADFIIFLDISPLLCFWRVTKRHHEYYGKSRRDIPEGCTDKLNLLRMWKALAFWFKDRRKLEKLLDKYPPEKIIRLSSSKMVKDFLTSLELHANEMGLSPKLISSVVEERRLSKASL
jgi:adenylate kinase family enzyme